MNSNVQVLKSNTKQWRIEQWENNEKAMKIMQSYEMQWKTMRKQWKTIETLYKAMENNEKQSNINKNHEKQWKIMKNYET